jgi:hypothetical protein
MAQKPEFAPTINPPPAQSRKTHLFPHYPVSALLRHNVQPSDGGAARSGHFQRGAAMKRRDKFILQDSAI